MCSGKTAYVDDFIRTYPKAIRLTFAEELKRICASRYGNPDGYDFGIKKQEWYEIYNRLEDKMVTIQGRSLLQQFGEKVKEFDHAFFYGWETKKIIDAIPFRGMNCVYVCEDLRLPEEYFWFKDRFDVKLIYLDAKEEVRDARSLARDGYLPTPEQKSHVSEQVEWAVEWSDMFIDNSENNNKFIGVV